MAERRWHERGTLRRPGPHLDRLPVGLDLAGISLSEGIRAAVASGLVLLASVWLGSFPLLLAAFAANLTCFCDAGGPARTRVRSMLAYTVLGAAAWMGFGLLRNLPWQVAIPPAALCVFLCSMARVWGLSALAVGNVLIVTVALALDKPLDGHDALVLGVSFVGGGLWAVLLTAVIWRINRGRPATRAVGHAWAALAALVADLRRLAATGAGDAAWDAHARAHRRATRIGLDEARQHVMAAVRARGPTSPAVQGLVVRLEAAETAFAALIALGDALEDSGPATRLRGARALRILRPMLGLVATGTIRGPERLEPVLGRILASGTAAPALSPSLRALCDALRIAAKMQPTNTPAAARLPTAPSTGLLPHVLQPLRANLTWNSAVLRHATRATLLTAPALAWSLAWWTPYAHWLTITVALTMQPYFAATWQRVLERIGGTLLGGAIGAAMAFLPADGSARALLLVPLCVIGFSVRQVSYGAYIACLTPLVVVLFDVAEPGHSDATIAAMRFGFTVAGGGLALVASLALWPRWDSRRLGEEVAIALAAYRSLAEAVFAHRLADGPDTTAARRAAGLASNNLEAALSRALQEPRSIKTGRVEAALAIDAALRRLGGALVALQHAPCPAVDTPRHEAESAWAVWLPDALGRLAVGEAPPGVPAGTEPASPMARLGRIVGMMTIVLASRSAVVPAQGTAAGLPDGAEPLRSIP